MKTLVVTFCYNALSNVNGLPNAERADHFDLAAAILAGYHIKDAAEAAKAVAQDLREAEASQLKLQALLSSAQN